MPRAARRGGAPSSDRRLERARGALFRGQLDAERGGALVLLRAHVGPETLQVAQPSLDASVRLFALALFVSRLVGCLGPGLAAGLCQRRALGQVALLEHAAREGFFGRALQHANREVRSTSLETLRLLAPALSGVSPTSLAAVVRGGALPRLDRQVLVPAREAERHVVRVGDLLVLLLPHVLQQNLFAPSCNGIHLQYHKNYQLYIVSANQALEHCFLNVLGCLCYQLFDASSQYNNYLKIVELNGKVSLEPFDIEYITLTHSILEPNGLRIKTPAGVILHTGDWKVDPNPLIGDEINSKRLKEIGDEGVLAMICDSTNVFSAGRSGSELDVRKNLLNIMSRLKKRIIITSFASNVARMATAFYCAEKTGRQISLVGRSMHRIYKAARQCGYLKNTIEPVDPRDAKNFSREKIVYLCTGSQGEPMGAMMRISSYTHPDVFIEKDDAVIFSSKIIPGNEKKLYKLHNQLVKDGIEVISEETEFIHVSGHPNREDLKDMYQWVKPKCVIPVHGEHRHMIEHINFAKEMQVPHPVQVENGDIVKIFPGNNPKVIDKAPSGRMYLDGSIGVTSDSQSIKERKNISLNGYLEVTLIVSNNGKIKKPNYQ